jgi:hypothetical protein
MAATQRDVEVRGSAASSHTPVPRARRTFTEAKNGFKTSEFYMMVLFVAGVLVATYVDSDSLARSDGWRYASFAVVAYIVSRGLSKLGVREPYDDDSR